MSDGAPHHDTGYGRQAFIVLLLIGGVILLHRFAVPTGVDASAMLALGFVILASYTIGELVGVIKVPHITGYLAAGLLFGPSAAAYIGQLLPFPPFEEGIINAEVLDSLRIFDTLAVALIALTAGGELKIAGLKKGFRAISGVLFGQMATLFLLVGGLIWTLSGPIPAIAVAELSDIGTLGAIGLGLVVASVSIATSPAATIAVINSTGAHGPMSRTVLSTVVLKDVVVVIAFSIASALAAGFLGMSSGDQNLGKFLAVHIGGSVLVGVALGFVLALYLRYVRREVLLVIVGVVYAASLMATSLHLDPVLLFMVAGFTAGNFSSEGDTLIHNVERLSMPVYVVFFTLAGAGLHLDAIADVGLVAAALVVVRLVALYTGVGVGARVGRADDATTRYGWLGFASQAGVAITLAAKVGADFGERGQYLETVIITGVAINELIGPVLLKVGLSLAGEIPKRTAHADGALGAGGDQNERKPRAGDDETGQPLDAWPEPTAGEAWGELPTTSSDELDRAAAELQEDLLTLVRDVTHGPLSDLRDESEAFLRQLRREYLRHHRRITVRLRDDGEALHAAAVHTEIAELAERWQSIVLGRSATIGQRRWSALKVVDDVDRVTDATPEKIIAPYEPEAFVGHEGQGTFTAIARTTLRAFHSIVGGVPEREVDVRALARYHFSGVATTKIEEFAALLIQGDVHLAARTRSLFDAIARGYEELLESQSEVPLEERLRVLRASVDEELGLALDEAARISEEGAHRLSSILGKSFSDFCRDLLVYGTLDLPASDRRTSRIFRERIGALDNLERRLVGVRESVSAIYSRLSLELELVGYDARVKDVLDEHVRALAQDVAGRTHTQAVRLEQAIAEARAHLDEELTNASATGEETAATIRQLTEPLEKVAGEAAAAAAKLREQLGEEATIAPLLDALRRAAHSIGDRYEVPAGRLEHGERRVPEPVPLVEIPCRELVTAHIESQVAPALVTANRNMISKTQPLVASFGELERLVAFNVELASTELDVVADEAVPAETRSLLREVLFGAFERSQEVIHGHAVDSSSWSDDFGRALREAVVRGTGELREQIADGTVTRERVELLRRRAAGQRLRQKAEALPSVFARGSALLHRTLVGLIGRQRIDGWRRFLGLRITRVANIPPPSAFSRPKPQARIPLVYRRLFAAKTVEAADVLTGREAMIEQARRVLGGKAPGRLRSVALVGPDGVGKSALARAIFRTRTFKGVRQIDFDAPATIEDVDAVFRDRVDGQLFVVDGFHWLVAMRAGGFAPLRRFVDGVIRDGGRNAWLIYGDRLVWQVACQAAPVSDAFPELIEVAELGAGELEAAVLARHGLSGYGLNFEPKTDRSRLEELFARSASRIRRPYEAYFRALHEASGGLVRDALRLWLTSIDEVNEAADFVHIGPVPPSPEGLLRSLPEDVLLNLYQVARQGWMNAEVQAHVYRVDTVEAEAQLARLTHMGLLEHRENGAYRIPVHLRGPVYRVLRGRGWVQ